jgi:DNA recombination protein RmuC
LALNPEYLHWWYAGGAALLGLLIGALITGLVTAQRRSELQSEIVRLTTELKLAAEMAETRLDEIKSVRSEWEALFAQLSGEALRKNSDQFLQLAKQNLEQHQVKADAELKAREQAVAHLIKPLQETLKRSEDQVQQMERQRKQEYGSLTKYLETLAQSQTDLTKETRSLVQALRRPEVRGQWGELTLRRLVELSGMVDHCDFYEQETHTGEGTTIRPDMIIRLPDDREIVVDVKTPLDAYLSAMEATDESGKQRELERHARQVRQRVRELAAKSYWQQFSKAPDFVVLFIPGEQFLSAALELDSELLEDSLREKVILATPTSFIALLRAVAYGWRQMVVAENAERIRDLGAELYGRLATFGDHLAKLGKQLGQSVESYNRAVGSLERQVLPSARRFPEMGISVKKEIEPLDPLDKQVRTVENGQQKN